MLKKKPRCTETERHLVFFLKASGVFRHKNLRAQHCLKVEPICANFLFAEMVSVGTVVP